VPGADDAADGETRRFLTLSPPRRWTTRKRMSTEIVRWVFFGIACMFAALWLGLMLVRRPARPPGDDVLALRYPTLLRYFALIVAMTIPLLMAYMMATFAWGSMRSLLVAGGSLAILSLLGGLLLLETEKVALYLTAESLVFDSPWRHRRTIRWSDVSRVSYSSLNRWYVFRDGANTTIRASVYLVGLTHLLTAIRVRIAPERWLAVRTLIDSDTRGEW
jgi:hypothetical protein